MRLRTAAAMLVVSCAIALCACSTPDATSEEQHFAEITVSVKLPASSDAGASPPLVAVEPVDPSSGLPSRAWVADGTPATVELPTGDYSVSLVCPVDSDGTVYSPVMPREISLHTTGLQLSVSPSTPIAGDRVSPDLLLGMAVAARECHDIDPSVSESISQTLLEMAEKRASELDKEEHANP